MSMNDDPVILAALLGASRPEALPGVPDERLSPLWDGLAGAEPAEALLGALAVSRSLRLAGTISGPAATTVDPAPPETRAELPPVAVDGLVRMLAGEFREALPEWLRHAAKSEAVAPARVLPELLHAGRREARLRPALAALCGERGRWVARRRPEHAWLLAEAGSGSGSGEGDWDADSPADRLAWLRTARHHDPEGCAARISEAWSGESPDFREALTRLAAADPLPADEGWLEGKALGERRQETRRFAAGALSQLPTSAFAARAIGRIRPLVQLKKKLLRSSLSVEPPAAFDPAWTADGLVEKPPARTGEKAWWLRQVVAAVPLARWSELLSLEPAKWLATPVDSDWLEALVLGWIDAALAAPALACAADFLPWLGALDPWPPAAAPRREVLATLLGQLPPEAQPKMLDALAAALPPPEVLGLMAAFSEDPPPILGNTARNLLRRALAAKPSPLTRPEARVLALCVPLDAIQPELEYLARLPELSTPAEEFASTLEFRRKLFTPS